VAPLALVLVRCASELPGVRVFVAEDAAIVRLPVACILALWNMAFPAFHSGVLAEQGIVRLLMAAHGERSLVECLFVVAAVAVLALELPLVRIRRVAISAEVMRHRLFEVAAFVAIIARRFDMRSVERKCGFVVIEG